jgi:hypothetical protein
MVPDGFLETCHSEYKPVNFSEASHRKKQETCGPSCPSPVALPVLHTDEAATWFQQASWKLLIASRTQSLS